MGAALGRVALISGMKLNSPGSASRNPGFVVSVHDFIIVKVGLRIWRAKLHRSPPLRLTIKESEINKMNPLEKLTALWNNSIAYKLCSEM